jgi:lipopolysaccharide export system protein LptA
MQNFSERIVEEWTTQGKPARRFCVRPSSFRAGSLVAFAFPAVLAASSGATDPVVTVAPAAAAVQPTPAVQDVQWSARLAELDPQSRVLVLTGEVSVRLERLELAARRMEARYERGADLRVLRGEGEVSVRLDNTTATAGRFELDLLRQRLVLGGPVRIEVAGGWTSAERAEIDTRSGRLTLHRVQGSLPLAPPRAR